MVQMTAEAHDFLGPHLPDQIAQAIATGDKGASQASDMFIMKIMLLTNTVQVIWIL